MRIDVLTLFPPMFEPVLGSSILKRAAEAGRVSYHLTDIRAHTTNKHGKVDDRPYGGGPGMVMACQPLWDCVQAVEQQDPLPATRVMMTPQGKPLTQPMCERLAELPRLLIIAGHYEGIDERVVEELAPLEISIGDYVLSGGELPAMVLIDAVVRLLPGVLGHDESAFHDSFSPGANRLLDHPHYTRPPEWRGKTVPDVLLSGDHAAIEKWRKQQAEDRTSQRRPDLMKERDEPNDSND
ncbi:MAG: tRNA (guanosine(37)-N1)-methyltransferase TrmD [Phycisphaera sp.]|nr:tRNA (guanosine(37)-N1)-methyltransferase TrmD [Phycisphaera sp.]